MIAREVEVGPVVVTPEQAASVGDVLTMADIQAAVDVLRANNVQPRDGYYAAVDVLRANNVQPRDGYYYSRVMQIPRWLHARGPILNAAADEHEATIWKRGWSTAARRRFNADAARRARYFRWGRLKPSDILNGGVVVMQSVAFIFGKPKKRTGRARRIRMRLDD